MPSSVASAAAMADEMATVSCDSPAEGSAAAAGGGCAEESAVNRGRSELRGRGFSTLGSACARIFMGDCDRIFIGDCDCDAPGDG